jgi:hypothetical protein
MANKTIRMSRIRQIRRLYTQGQSRKKISELTCSSHNTVKKYIHKFIHEHLTYDLISVMSDHELDLLFGYTQPAVKDKRFEQLQSLLPDMEKQMKRMGEEDTRPSGDLTVTQYFYVNELTCLGFWANERLNRRIRDSDVERFNCKLAALFLCNRLSIIKEKYGMTPQAQHIVRCLDRLQP